MKNKLAVILFFALTTFCQAQQEVHFRLPYQLNTPDHSLILDNDLAEISGLSFDENEETILAVQDENGIIFFIDRESGAIVKQVEFWKDGDYEGIEMANGEVFVVKSTGTIYRVQNIGTEEQTVIKYNDFLESENDIEGLAFDPITQNLMLACKANPGNNLQLNQLKAIYSFNLEEGIVNPEPCVLISREAIVNYLSTCNHGYAHEKICSFFDAAKIDFDLSPSAIAIHPITGHVYLTSSKGKILLVMDRTGAILHIEKLDKDIHPQPEGLCFDSNGTLFISNEEKRGLPPTIHSFSFNPETVLDCSSRE